MRRKKSSASASRAFPDLRYASTALDAARGASAARVTAVIPYYAYARSDKKSIPRVSIGGRLVADLLVTAGADRVLGYGLKYGDNFQHTHLGQLGQPGGTP